MARRFIIKKKQDLKPSLRKSLVKEENNNKLIIEDNQNTNSNYNKK